MAGRNDSGIQEATAPPSGGLKVELLKTPWAQWLTSAKRRHPNSTAQIPPVRVHTGMQRPGIWLGLVCKDRASLANTHYGNQTGLELTDFQTCP